VLDRVRLSISSTSISNDRNPLRAKPPAMIAISSAGISLWHCLLHILGRYTSILVYLLSDEMVTSRWLLYNFPLSGKSLYIQLTNRSVEAIPMGWALPRGRIALKNTISKDSDLMIDCYQGSVEEVRQHLIRRKGRIHNVTRDGDTPLAVCSFKVYIL
jgi:hypothetical protein